MKKLNRYLLSLIVLTVLLSVSFLTNEKASAQVQIDVKLQTPPAGQFHVEDMWKVTVSNTSKETYSVYFYGTLTEKKAGMIANATTDVRDIKPGVTNIKASDFPKQPDVSYSGDPKYKDALIKKGSLPPGEYTYCIYAKLKKNNQEMGSDCLVQIIDETGMISLTLPNNEDEISPNTPVTFSWMSSNPKPGAKYSLRIVEVMDKQSPMEALKNNKAYFVKDNLASTTFNYPTSAAKFLEGKKYAWAVISGQTQSEIYSFSIGIITQDESSYPMPCPGNLIKNWSFNIGATQGAMPSPGSASNWSRSYGSPDVNISQGCDYNGSPTKGFINLWGNKVVGEAIHQTLATSQQIIAGKTYKIELFGKKGNDPHKMLPVQFEFRASNSLLIGPGCNSGCKIMGRTHPTVSQTWTPMSFIWQANANYNTVTISATNYSSTNNGDSTSSGQIDNVCIYEIPTDTFFDDLYITLSKLETNESNIDNIRKSQLIEKMLTDSLGKNDLEKTLTEFYKLNSEDCEYVLGKIREKKFVKSNEEEGLFSDFESKEIYIRKLITDLNKYSMDKFKQPFHISALKGMDVYPESIMKNYEKIILTNNTSKGGNCEYWDPQDYASISWWYQQFTWPNLVFYPRKTHEKETCENYGFRYNYDVNKLCTFNPLIINMIYLNSLKGRLPKSGTQVTAKNWTLWLAGTPPIVIKYGLRITYDWL